VPKKTVEGQHRKKGIVETVQAVQREGKGEEGYWILDPGYWAKRKTSDRLTVIGYP
jgi:hypothetical protein